MIKMKDCKQAEKQEIVLGKLTDDEICVICRFRAMRASARKMIFDLTAEYAREFPDPAHAGSGN